MSENKTNNQREVRNYENDIHSAIRNLTALKEKRKHECNHKACSQGKLIYLHDSNVNFPNKKEMPKSTVVCTRCEKVFEEEYYEDEEVESGIYMLESMAEQVKFISNLTKEDQDAIASYYDAIDTIKNFSVYYSNMVKKLRNGNDNKKSKNRNTKGHMGINSGMFGGRGF